MQACNIPSKIQLDHYFLKGLNYSFNPDFDPEGDSSYKLVDITEEHEICPLNEEDQKEWQVDLKVSFSPSMDSNSTYSVSAEIVGFFTVLDGIEKDQIHSFVDVNATSVLYSTLREIIYTITAKGPYFPLMLPTLCFYEQKNDEEASDEKEDTKE